jgi:hypothetical protein
MPELTPEEMLEVESDRRRRVTAAFRLGSEASPGTTGPSWIGPIAIGLAVALAIALVMGVIALAQSSAAGGASKSPVTVATPGTTPGR